jgi:protein tyrosine phosphatase (PTP) superfamily phosphohydrolase (DUF442 family)
MSGMRSTALLVWAMAALGGLSIAAFDDSDAPEDPEAPRPVPATGIENLYRLGPNLYSGSQPEGEAGFSALRRLGIRTIVTVDGAQPDVEAARSQGMRYVHLPIGYDGVPADQAVRLIKAVRSLPGPVFVHCHHGKHRGPAAAAVCAIATEGWTPQQARAWLVTAGTSPDYKGLFTSVERFVPPTEEDLARVKAADLPERAEVPALVESMVQVDALWDHLKAIQKAGFRPPTDAPDLDPPHEALMLAEQFREAARHPEAQRRGPEFTRLMADAERTANLLREALKDRQPTSPRDARTGPDDPFTRLGNTCTACHARFRDR